MDPTTIPFKETDLMSWGGLMLIVPIIVSLVKTLVPKWTDGKEPILAVGLSYLLGIAGKISMKTAFGTSNTVAGWTTFLIGLLFVAVMAMQLHDNIIHKVIQGNTAPPGLPPPKA
jgi:uncharacterized membrane protein